MQKKLSKILGVLVLVVFTLFTTNSVEATGFVIKKQDRYFRELTPFSFVDDNDKVLAVCQSTSTFPKGWVVIGQGNVNDCRNSSIVQPLFNAWFIKKPAKEEAVCQGSPLPDDYAVVGKVKIADCPGGSPILENKNGWIIKLIE